MEEKQIQMVFMVAGVIIQQDNKYLLVQEGKGIAYKLWNFPAGKVDLGESIEEAAIREAFEEVGYKVELIKKISVHQKSVDEPVKHIFEARVIGGELKTKKGEILDAKWFSSEEIKNMENELRNGEWIIDVINIFEKNNTDKI